VLRTEECDFIDALRATILVSLIQDRPQVHAIAKRAGISVRTMQRGLAVRGTTFSQVLEDVRREGARSMLRETVMPLTAIAASLGYSNLSSFSRAFRRWSGQSPSEFRSRSRGERDDPRSSPTACS
jgi:AraC-like DNA-binding protein